MCESACPYLGTRGSLGGLLLLSAFSAAAMLFPDVVLGHSAAQDGTHTVHGTLGVAFERLTYKTAGSPGQCFVPLWGSSPGVHKWYKVASLELLLSLSCPKPESHW